MTDEARPPDSGGELEQQMGRPVRRRESEARVNPGAPRDVWFKIDVLGRPLAGILATIAVGVIGWFGNKALEQTQSARLLMELMSQREQAESQIRKDMFTAILNQFFADSAAANENIPDQLLRLELLALNFGETLSLSPLFRELDRELRNGPPSDMLWRLKVAPYRKRLRSLAKRVSSWQLSKLEVGGEIESIELDLKSVMAGRSYEWPYDAVLEEWSAQASVVDGKAEFMEQKENEKKLTLGDVSRTFRVTIQDADTTQYTVHVKIEWWSDTDPVVQDVEFDLGYFDFPMIDNTRLQGDHRFALVLVDFAKDHIELAAVLFPGLYASQREQPFLNEVINQVQEQIDK
jgi:hypothetical protein